jgi:cobalamin biosynthesis protein CobT
MLTDKKITVTQRGTDAYVQADPKTGCPNLVNIPHVPDEAPDDLLEAINGFLDHEVAHVLFTEFNVVKKARTPQIAGMLNILEDIRIEKAMSERFRGSAYNIGTLGKFFLERMTAPMLKEALRKGDKDQITSVLIPPMLRALGGQRVFEEFMTPDMIAHVAPFYAKVKDLAAEIKALDSTEAALVLAEKIDGRMRVHSSAPRDTRFGKEGAKSESEGGKAGKDKTRKPPKEKKKSEKDTSKVMDEKAEELEAEKPEDLESARREKPEAADERVEDEEADEGEELEEAERESESASEEEATDFSEKAEHKIPEASEEPERDFSDPEEGGEGSTTEEDDFGEEEEGGMSGEEFDRAMSGVSDFDSSVGRSISDTASKVSEKADYLVYTTDLDTIEILPVPESLASDAVGRLEDEVNHLVAPMQKDLERIIAARSLATWSSGHRSGKLHAANLSRVLMNDPRVFRRRHETTTKDSAVELVIDASGSMSGEKIIVATQAAFALSQVLERIGIKHEVIAFTTHHNTRTLPSEAHDLDKYVRYEPLYMPILKGYDERLNTEVKRRFAALPRHVRLANNVDGECVEIAARRLMTRKEKGKTMIVLSDGFPQARADCRKLASHLKQVVNQVEASGVRVVGLGIQSEAVEKFYKRRVVLNDLKELPTTVMKELKTALAQ